MRKTTRKWGSMAAAFALVVVVGSGVFYAESVDAGFNAAKVDGYATDLEIQEKLNNQLLSGLRGDGARTLIGCGGTTGDLSTCDETIGTVGRTAGIAEIEGLVAPGLIVAISVTVAFVGFYMIRSLIMRVRG